MYHEELFAGGHANWGLFGGAYPGQFGQPGRTRRNLTQSTAAGAHSGRLQSADLGTITCDAMSEAAVALQRRPARMVLAMATGEVIYDCGSS